MPRAWTRRGQIEMIEEISLVARQVDVIASQERARGSSDTSLQRLRALLKTSQGVLSHVKSDLASGSSPFATACDLFLLHGIVVRETARADARRHGRRR